MRRKKKGRWVRGRWWRWRWRAVGSRSMRGEGREVSIASHSGGGWEDRWMENRTRNKVHVRMNGAYMQYNSQWGRPRRRAVLKQNICVRISMLRRSGPLEATCFPPQAGQKTTRILHTYASKGRVHDKHVTEPHALSKERAAAGGTRKE